MSVNFLTGNKKTKTNKQKTLIWYFICGGKVRAILIYLLNEFTIFEFAGVILYIHFLLLLSFGRIYLL